MKTPQHDSLSFISSANSLHFTSDNFRSDSDKFSNAVTTGSNVPSKEMNSCDTKSYSDGISKLKCKLKWVDYNSQKYKNWQFDSGYLEVARWPKEKYKILLL